MPVFAKSCAVEERLRLESEEEKREQKVEVGFMD